MIAVTANIPSHASSDLSNTPVLKEPIRLIIRIVSSFRYQPNMVSTSPPAITEAI